MAVSKKKRNRKLRKVIRRTLSGICMVSAIIVACIPSRKTEAYKEPSGIDYTYGVEDTDYTPSSTSSDRLYADGVDLKRFLNPSFDDSDVNPAPANPNVYKILKVSQLTDGTYTVNWQFKIYLENVRGVKMGVIGQYNSTYATGTVSISPTMPYEYVVIDSSEYDEFYKKYENAFNSGSATTTTGLKAVYKSDYDTYISKFVTSDNENYTSSDDEYWLKRYFDDLYTQYRNKFRAYEKYKAYEDYLAAYAAWEAAGSDPDTEPERVERVDPVSKPALTCYVHEMSTDNKLSYFCDVNPDYNTSSLSLKGYKLVEVADYRKPSEGIKMPIVYMPKGEPNPYFSSSTQTDDSTTNKNDELGFRIKEKCLVIAIGEDAFRETTNVENLDICSEIKYIGDNAFRDSFVQSVTFQNVKNIGNRAFKGCSRLNSIDLKDGAVNIGTEAFYGCKFEELSFPYSIEYIGPGAFANCTKLRGIDFSKMNRDESIIDNFAFYDDIALNSIEFSDSITKIGDCAFACAKGIAGSLSEFRFPDHIYEADGIGNFVIAGRTNMQYVIMPSDYGKNSPVTLPYGTFFNCISLKSVEFPAVGGACGLVSFGESASPKRTIFDTIQTPDFYVRGPEKNIMGDIASPRKSTWGQKTNLGNDVPYIYTDAQGNEHFEISNGQYIFIIDDYGILQSCTLAEEVDLAAGIDMVIPEVVGTTKVTGISSECFSNPDLRNNMVTLKFKDNSVSEIAPEAFKDCPRLKYVSIGNSINKIGDSAFEGCNLLTHVNFETPASGYASFPAENIGNNAFSTGADSLIFEGDIDQNYGPFLWATAADNYVDEKNGIRVCYQTGYPTYLTVLVDNRNNYPTLVDYPHYNQIDVLSGTDHDAHPLSERYEKLGETYIEGDAEYVYTMTLEEERLVNSALNLEVPSGVQSVDSLGYMTNTSKQDESVNTVRTNTNNVFKYLLSSDYYDQYKKYGLFSGYYGSESGSDGAREYPEGSSNEKNSLGNDRLNSVTLNSVKYLPDYCFDNCEQLKSVYISADCEDLGAAPFRGCTNLTGVAINSRDYSCENGILYKNKEDGGLKIVEVLASRGSLVGNSRIKVDDEDPRLANVTEIADSAFMDADSLYSVDLRGMSLCSEIPDNCFKDSDKLGQVILPPNFKSVGHEAFAGCKDGLKVTFYGREVFLPGDAFKGMSDFAVVSYRDSAVRRAAKDLGADVSEVLDDTIEIQFFDWDGKALSDVIYIVEGSDVSKDVIPDNPTRKGYIFKGWDKSLKAVMVNTLFFAQYDKDPNYNPDDPDNPYDPDNPGSESGSSNSNTGSKTSNSKSNSNSKSSNSKSNSNSGSGSGSDSNSGSSSGGGGNPGGGVSDDKTFYTLTVEGGNGSGSYMAGSTVIITCTSVPAGQAFSKWVPETNDLGIASVSVAATTLVMPSHNASVKATFTKVGSGSSTTTSGTSTTTSGSSNSDSGTKVVISKNGISNTALASATVTGSPDDYVIRVTETQAATEAVEAALTNEYGSLDNVRYTAMDISLYDSTGSNKITDYSGLSITITLPIPDVLTQYKGNNKVASVSADNRLEKLNPKFTSIDGVPCITFTTTHFSPYTIYADVNNLSDSTIDETPKTGDGIQPKWFLSFGLAALSIALFFMKDRKPVRVRVA